MTANKNTTGSSSNSSENAPSADASADASDSGGGSGNNSGGGLDYVFIDTPGQIEVFTWSAGGQIIHEVLYTYSTLNPIYCINKLYKIFFPE